MPHASPMDSAAPHLLDGVSAAEIALVPFVHLRRENAVDPAAYRALEAGFPKLSEFLEGRDDPGNNAAVRLTAKQVLLERRFPGLWRDFFAYHTSAAYWHRVVALFGPALRASFPDLEARIGRSLADWRVLPRGFPGEADLRLDCQFVMNTPVTRPSSVKLAHVDLCDKIFSALFYFRDSRDTAAGGDLELYRWRRAPRFVKHRVLTRDVERVASVPYAANTYVCFINSPLSVHGVSPRGLSDIPRRYINFIAELPIKAFRPPQLSRLQRFRFAREVREAMQEEGY